MAMTTFSVDPIEKDATFQCKPQMQHEDCVMVMTRSHFRVVWWVILILFSLDTAFLVATSWLYGWMLYTPVVMYNVQNILALLPMPTLKVILMAFPILAVCYALSVMEIVGYSLQQGHLALASKRAPRITPEPTTTISNFKQLTIRQRVASRVESMRTHSNKLIAKWYHPYFSLDGEQYDKWFAVKDVLQVVSQAYQCYSLSWLVTTRWINQLAVASTIINCLSTPLVRWMVPYHNDPQHNRARQRVFTALCDCTIGIVQCVAIPLIIFYPYYRVYDLDTQYFPYDLVYLDTWYNEAINELDQIFIVSYLDYLTTIFPHFSVLISLRSAGRMIRYAEDKEDSKTTTPADSRVTKLHQIEVQSTRASVAVRARNPKRSTKWRDSSIHSVLSIISAATIVALHLTASSENQTTKVYCKSHPNAWFAHNYTCLVAHINCHRHDLQGNTSELSAILQQFNTKALAYLILSHCPALEMPSYLHQFPSLEALNVYNSTIVKWDQTAALDARYHTMFKTLTMQLVNMSSIPEGVLGPNLPPSFYDVEIYGSNVSVLPDDIGLQWVHVNVLYLEFCQLKTLPSSVGAMSLLYLSLVGNELEELKSEWFEKASLGAYTVSNNPLKSLPESMGNLDLLFYVGFEDTQIARIPDWLMHHVVGRDQSDEPVTVSAMNTPFCDASSVSTVGSLTGENDVALVATFKQLACAQSLQSSIGLFPIYLVGTEWPY